MVLLVNRQGLRARERGRSVERGNEAKVERDRERGGKALRVLLKRPKTFGYTDPSFPYSQRARLRQPRCIHEIADFSRNASRGTSIVPLAIFFNFFLLFVTSKSSVQSQQW